MSDAYTAALATGSTALCRCFRLTRADGASLGFTDHDGPITFDGLTYLPESALSASEASANLGLAPDELDAAGALSADAITEADLAAGRYDGAEVLVFDVDWRDPSVRRLLGRYTIGEVERGAVAFRAELRSLAAGLDRAQGRIHSTLCDVRRLGDAHCGLALGPWTATGTVTAATAAEVQIATASGLDPRLMARGVLTWTGGVNAGAEAEIRAGRKTADGWALALWSRPPEPVQVGDTLSVVVGCDRTADTCSARFGNLVNFHGFPHMPGPEVASEYAVPSDPTLDGGSRFN